MLAQTFLLVTVFAWSHPRRAPSLTSQPPTSVRRIPPPMRLGHHRSGARACDPVATPELQVDFPSVREVVDPDRELSDEFRRETLLREFEKARVWDTRAELEKVVGFCLPAVSTTLAEPLMSFIDTVCIGASRNSALSLAALGPNVVVNNFLLWTFCFIGAATTIEASVRLAQNDDEAAQRIVAMAVSFAVVLGVATTAVLLRFAVPLIVATGAQASVVGSAVEYLRIRALSTPAVMVSMVLQGALLAQRDALVPLAVIAATSAVNIVGDALLVLGGGMGLKGAAIATTVAQWLAVPLFLAWGFRGPGRRVELRWARPRGAEVRSFAKRSLSISAIFVSLNASFLLLCSKATTFSTIASAAHQAMWSLFNLLMSATMPLQQAAQVFLPSYVALDAQRGAGPHLAPRLLGLLLAVGAGAGLVLGAVGLATPHLAPGLFTADPRLHPIMQSVSSAAFVSLLLAGAVQVVDGAYLAMGGMQYLVRCSFANVALVAGYLWWAVSRCGLGVQAVWQGLTLLYVARALESVFWMARRRIAGQAGGIAAAA